MQDAYDGRNLANGGEERWEKITLCFSQEEVIFKMCEVLPVKIKLSWLREGWFQEGGIM